MSLKPTTTPTSIAEAAPTTPTSIYELRMKAKTNMAETFAIFTALGKNGAAAAISIMGKKEFGEEVFEEAIAAIQRKTIRMIEDVAKEEEARMNEG